MGILQLRSSVPFRRWPPSAVLALVATAHALAQSVPASQPDSPNAQPATQLPWPVRLGLRSHQVTNAFPLIDRVVLVPDAATYLDELSKWSPTGRWPVLIEDDQYTPMFVRRFKPAQLIRRESVGGLPDDTTAHRKLLSAVVIRAFGGDPARHSIRETFDAQSYVPAGVVVTSTNEPAWTAAVALAAGRGQPLAWLDEPFGTPNDELDHDTARRLIDAVDALIAEQNYKFDSLGDQIDAITICRSMANRARFALPQAERAAVPAPHNEGPIAITDLLGRRADFTRFAYSGWIFGDQARSAYMAMCSLFLAREQIWMCNTYPENEPAWAAYAMAGAAQVLTGAGYRVSQPLPSPVNEAAWQKALAGGLATDMAVMNTKGNDDFFDLSSGGGRGYPRDVPILKHPVALHLIHSWAMRSPTDLETVGGRWLENGAYAAVGSCWEPLLHGFVPPDLLARRCASFVPFLIAARWWDGEPGISKPWRIVTIGDPLMLCPPPAQIVKPRVAQPADYGVDLGERVKALMKESQIDQTGASLTEAIKILNLLGNDDVAIELWKIAAQRSQVASARAVLESAFHRGDVEEFLATWDSLSTRSRDRRAMDLLWHLLFGQLASPADPRNHEVLQRLELAIRHPSPQIDIERLGPHLAKAFGPAHGRTVIEREIDKAADARTKRALRDLLGKF